MAVAINTLVFDFDGLILDTEGPELQSWQEIYDDHGFSLSLSTWAACIGASYELFSPYDDLESRLGIAIDREAVRTRHKQRCRELLLGKPPLPGVEDYISDAGRLGLRLGIASSSPAEWVTGHLSRLGLLDAFACIKCAEDVKRRKPDPDLYQAALAALRSEASEAVAFEDSPNGITAAKLAGMLCVAVPNDLTRQLPVDHADLRLASLGEIPLEELLARLGENGRA